jgi:hypothetical protein
MIQKNIIRRFVNFTNRITTKNISVRCCGRTKIFCIDITSRMTETIILIIINKIVNVLLIRYNRLSEYFTMTNINTKTRWTTKSETAPSCHVLTQIKCPNTYVTLKIKIDSINREHT